MTTEDDRKCHDRVALSDLIARLVDEVGGVPDMYASDHDRLVAVMGQITRHVWPEARGALVPFGLDAEDVSLRQVLVRINETNSQLADVRETAAMLRAEGAQLRSELGTARALNEELRKQLDAMLLGRSTAESQLADAQAQLADTQVDLTNTRAQLKEALDDAARLGRQLAAEQRRKSNAHERRGTKVTVKTATVATPKVVVIKKKDPNP